MRWRTIPGHRDYEISKTGIVRRRLPARGTYVGRIMSRTPSTNGYLYCCLDREWCAVHVLMCRTYRGPKPSRHHHAAHSNGRRTDNRWRNVRWKTQAQNEADKLRHGTRTCGNMHPFAKLSPAKVRRIRALAGRVTQVVLGARYGVDQNIISDVINRKRWKHVS